MEKDRLIKIAIVLSLITIGYNVVEGLISVYFGMSDETLALFGFGVDSFVEVISGIGVAHLVFRMKKANVEQRDSFERLALRITGSAFYLLTAGLLFGAIINIVSGSKPETTLVGIIISLISIATMYFLMKAKLSVGRRLNSDAIIADANCTKTCFYLSIILLASSGLYELFGIAWFDIAGSLGIAWYAFREGKESFEKAASASLECHCESECATEDKVSIKINY